tara:strand:- start:7255 stop:8634 length:1380 start_codon:yes stop_codon:yes gene_type:complete
MQDNKNSIDSKLKEVGTQCKKWVFDLKTKLLDRKIYQKHLENEHLLVSMDAAALSKYNFEKRKDLVAHALKHSDFYKDKYASLQSTTTNLKTEEDFAKLPILTREDLRENFGSITAADVRKKDCHKMSTSGSTGPAISVFHDKRFPTAPTQWRLLQWWGIRPYVNKAFIYRYPRPLFTKILNTLLWWPTKRIFLAGTEMDEEHMRKFVNAINKTRPLVLQGYTDVVYDFALFLLDHEIRIQAPKGVWVTSGPLTKQQRSTMQKAFCAPVYDQYGSTEVLYVAAECRQQNGLHILHDMVYVECVDEYNRPVPQNTLGKILLTDLNNYAFPLIRYDIGDYGQLLSGACACGMPLPLMDNVKGRQSAVIKTPSGTPLNVAYLTTLFDDFPESIRAYQFLQEEDYSVRLCYIPFKDKKVDGLISKVIDEMVNKTDAEIKISSKEVKSMTKVSGKVPMVICAIE